MPSDKYYVIEILNKQSILINYGRNDGARKGDHVRVISIGPEVINPITNEKLGTMDDIKDTLMITTVYERFSLCKKVEVTTKNVLVNPLTQFQSTSRIVIDLNVNEADISNREIPSDKTIRVGDIVDIL